MGMARAAGWPVSPACFVPSTAACVAADLPKGPATPELVDPQLPLNVASYVSRAGDLFEARTPSPNSRHESRA
ncbi:hypothetical protein X737_28995 [Mesorhizobium sp. L48C026A00]|nr:hypothetical protein X737_28995 [Mesorhizobium sp. L48C026A00]